MKNKSENYEDQTLKWIFLLNNTYKLAKLFNETNKNQTEIKLTIYGLFILAGKSELKTFYDKEIINYKREYSAWLDLFKKFFFIIIYAFISLDNSWTKLIGYIQDLNQKNPFSGDPKVINNFASKIYSKIILK